MSFEQEYQHHKVRWIEPDEQVVKWLAAVPSGRALDLGAGEGGNSFWLAQQGWDVTSVDAAPSAVKFITDYAKAKGYAIQSEVADARTYTGNAPFDLILLSFVHFSKKDRENLFARLEKQLAEDGVMVYLDLVKTEDELPPGGSLQEFPPSDEIAEEWKVHTSLDIVEQVDDIREVPIGVTQGMYLARTVGLIGRKGRDDERIL
ncbi:SAM-dependent methyltransferase [Halobacillus litoralis]|uniref:SAM-dependent methyltransferase n=1 Tax=Halobacillus litoralis TaxID=45668 RepID=UPI001CD2663C|nr:class I SAM-dependent methyltransferase [Halobacillus litoralis]MCA1022167.1 class I SAM-dependent methyltransferase [Halobacillus litoralis]